MHMIALGVYLIFSNIQSFSLILPIVEIAVNVEFFSALKVPFCQTLI